MAQAIDQLIEEEEIRAQTFIDELEAELIQRRYLDVVANWDYASNITDYNEKRKNEVSADNARFAKVNAPINIFSNWINSILFN